MAETDNDQHTQTRDTHSQLSFKTEDPSPKTEDRDMSEQVGSATNIDLDDPGKKTLLRSIQD